MRRNVSFWRIAAIVFGLCSSSPWVQRVFSAEAVNAAAPPSIEVLPGTQPLQAQGDMASAMVAGADKFLLRQIDDSVKRREKLWKRDLSSAASYEKSVVPNREHLKKDIGAVDPREPVVALELVATTTQSALVGRGQGFEVYAARWPVLRGVTGEGLLLKPTGRKAVADCVAIPDADQTPEMLAGLVPGIAAKSQFGRRLAESGCRVLIPLILDRADTYSVSSSGRATNQPHREYIYRAAFEMGRHVIGYEVQKVLAAVDWFRHDAGELPRPIGVIGYGEGGLLSLYAGAVDPRIYVTSVSGYFDSRQDVWQEPIYRNVWSLLQEFGDAELASLIAPRALIVEASQVPTVTGPPAPHDGRGGAAPGRLSTPSRDRVEREVARAQSLVAGLAPAPHLDLIASGNGDGPFGSRETLQRFLNALAPGTALAPPGPAPRHLRVKFEPQIRLKRQFDELDNFTQNLLLHSADVRRKFWAKADISSVAAWQKSTEWYRDYFAKEVIGHFDIPPLPPHPRTRKIYDEPAFVGYEVMLDVFPDVFAYGILLVPKNIPPGERRPVVVCQHGLEGRPQDVANPKFDSPYYHQFACRLAQQGFITYAPQNLYIFTDRFRTLQRKGNVIKKSLFSIIVPQHQTTVDWLASLTMVDPQRIGFYGLSYGGKTAMRVPPLVKNYCLSICSADFNEWVWKNATTTSLYSYVTSGEYEIFEWDLGSTFNYAEMAGLIAPRPFMVERGHHDGVAPDETVAYEFAKVRHLYAALKIPNRASIEFFDGPHTINGVGTFAFLHEHLHWPIGQR